MADFSYICKNLSGSASSGMTETGAPACARHLKAGIYCSADSVAAATAGKTACPSADYLKILVVKKKKW
jgi:hypothetical protein